MIKTVHILNGDSTALLISKSGLQGDVIVWREMLCEGDLDVNVGSDDFWSKRYVFFKDELEVSKLEYFDKTIKELIKIEDLFNYTEVVLWFEYDLFCQVNLMALCTYLLKHYRKDILYYLVCTGKEKGEEKLQTLADYSAEQYQELYESKVKLTRNDLLYAEQCWMRYVENDFNEIKEFNFNKNAKFKYFQLVMNQHLKRFSDAKRLNEIGYKIINTINAKDFSKKEIIKELLVWQQEQTVYGFGDLQYVSYLDKLNKFYEIKEEKYYLNSKGKEVLTN